MRIKCFLNFARKLRFKISKMPILASKSYYNVWKIILDQVNLNPFTFSRIYRENKSGRLDDLPSIYIETQGLPSLFCVFNIILCLQNICFHKDSKVFQANILKNWTLDINKHANYLSLLHFTSKQKTNLQIKI